MEAQTLSVQGALSCDEAYPLAIGQTVSSRFRRPTDVHYYQVPIPDSFTDLKIVVTPEQEATYALYQRCKGGELSGPVPLGKGAGIRPTSRLFLAVQPAEGRATVETYTLHVQRGAMMA